MSKLQRAQILLEQSRYELAEKELHGALADDPNDGMAQALLSICLGELEKHVDSLQAAKEAVRLDPDESFSHYALAQAFIGIEQLNSAESSIREALRLSPESPDYFATLAAIYHNQHKWSQSLEAADEGLALDAEHVTCANLRALALTKLKRRQEAGESLSSALARDPENALTHANRGWSLLEEGRHQEALESFREALRLEADHAWAREGILEALRAKSPLYRLVLIYFFWIGRFTRKMQWGVVIGLYIGYRVLVRISRANPDLAPYIKPLLYAYIAFVLTAWMAKPLFNLALRLNRFGRLALDRSEIVASNWVGGFLFFGLAMLIYGWGDESMISFYGFSLILMVIPISGVYHARRPEAKRKLTIAAVVLGAMLFLSLGMYLLTGSTGGNLLGLFFIGILIYSFWANAVM